MTDYVGGNSLTIFNIASQQVERTISLASYPKPHGVLFMPDKTRVAVSSEGSDTALIVNIQSGQIEKVLATHAKGSHMVALPASGEVVYTTNMASNNVSVLDVKTGALRAHRPMPATPEATTVSSDNKTLWVGSNKDGWLSVYDTQSEQLLSRWQDYSWPYRILYSPDERHVVVPDLRQNSLDIYDGNTLTRIRRITLPDGASPKGISFHPSQPIVFLSLYEKNQITVINVLTGERLFHLPTGDGPDGIGFVMMPTQN